MNNFRAIQFDDHAWQVVVDGKEFCLCSELGGNGNAQDRALLIAALLNAEEDFQAVIRPEETT